MVPKIRIETGDYRSLNSVTIPDRYRTAYTRFYWYPSWQDNFSKIDLVRAYHQIPVEPADVPKTAITTPFGLFEFVRMPFGLKNAAQTFQRFIDEVLRGLPFVYAYLDDLLVASSSAEEHYQHLNQYFNDLTAMALISTLVNKAETRYSAFGRELLAVYLSIRHFRHLLDGRSFTVYTDHKPLTYAFASKPDRYSPREIRHLDYISQYSTDLRHIPGRDNVVADVYLVTYTALLSPHHNRFHSNRIAQQHDDELFSYGNHLR
ncbi:hypothetical protein BSL78_01224 [Apostichopus japonicus]|uniref:Reverse transcriptase domain-containing protein n=1 Tax=Stichopus japonicus TaxID=307972 RepID=A0A2G8LNQ9_STIJA|nr:hypothetical protein BSL78_01224 [Apostichopus japonicus]